MPVLLPEPKTANDEESAKQATDYCNWVFYRENEGLLILHNWFKDALLQKVGVVKSYWDAKEDVTKEKYQSLTEDEMALLLSDESLEVVRQSVEMVPAGVDMMGMPIEAPSYSVTVKRVNKYGCVKIENVPPEEFLISKAARNIEDAPFVAHRNDDLVDLSGQGVYHSHDEWSADYWHKRLGNPIGQRS